MGDMDLENRVRMSDVLGLRPFRRRLSDRLYFGRGEVSTRLYRLKRRPGLLVSVASLTFCLVVTAAWLGIVAQAHFDTADQRLVALGDVFAGGIFLLAVIAAIVSVLAYAESSRRPHLRRSWYFRWADGRNFVNVLPIDQASERTLPPLGVVGDPVPLEPVTLCLRVENDGDAGALNVTVAIYLEGVFFSPPPAQELNSPWRLVKRGDQGWWQVQWEGRTDRPVYPGDVARTPEIDLSGMWAVPGVEYTGWGSVYTLADGQRQPNCQPLDISIEPITPDGP
jgi:hypothetical protein